MLMQKKILVTAMLAGFAALPTLAMAQAKGNADLGFYAGISAGQSKSDCPGGGSCDDKDTAYRVFGGYKFHPNIAVEGGYSPLGETSGGSITERRKRMPGISSVSGFFRSAITSRSSASSASTTPKSSWVAWPRARRPRPT